MTRNQNALMHLRDKCLTGCNHTYNDADCDYCGVKTARLLLAGNVENINEVNWWLAHVDEAVTALDDLHERLGDTPSMPPHIKQAIGHLQTQVDELKADNHLLWESMGTHTDTLLEQEKRNKGFDIRLRVQRNMISMLAKACVRTKVDLTKAITELRLKCDGLRNMCEGKSIQQYDYAMLAGRIEKLELEVENDR
jgi:hypothetical protein